MARSPNRNQHHGTPRGSQPRGANATRTPDQIRCTMLRQLVARTDGGARTLMDQNFPVITPTSGAQTYNVAIDELLFDADYVNAQFQEVHTPPRGAASGPAPQAAAGPTAASAAGVPPAGAAPAADVSATHAPNAASAAADIDPREVGHEILAHFIMNGTQYTISENKISARYLDCTQKDSRAYVNSSGGVIVYVTVIDGTESYPFTVTKDGYPYKNLKNYIRTTYPHVPPAAAADADPAPAAPPQVNNPGPRNLFPNGLPNQPSQPNVGGGAGRVGGIRAARVIRDTDYRRFLDTRPSPDVTTKGHAQRITDRVHTILRNPAYNTSTPFDAFLLDFSGNVLPSRYPDRRGTWQEASYMIQDAFNTYFTTHETGILRNAVPAKPHLHEMFTSAHGYVSY